MEFSDQYRNATAKTLIVRNEVSVSIFDDKVREMGTISVSNGKISITIYSLPGMTTDENARDFLFEAINLGLRECYNAKADAFDPYTK